MSDRDDRYLERYLWVRRTYYRQMILIFIGDEVNHLENQPKRPNEGNIAAVLMYTIFDVWGMEKDIFRI